jgi:hypothetical protein
MAIGNAIRPLSFGLLVALSALASTAQAAPATINGASPEAGSVSALAHSPAVAEMAPPKAPKVTCVGDQLTISADNSTLGGVLAAVHTCTGAKVDIPDGAAESRVFEELGPGPARQVLESLLSGTDFNYVIGSSDADPQKVETVLLMMRTTDDAPASEGGDRTMTPARRLWLQALQKRRASAPSGDESGPAAEETPDIPAADDAAAAPADSGKANGTQTPPADTPPPAADMLAPSVDSVAAPAPIADSSSGANPALGSDKSTEERISDMQQMFQQRRQMNQNQNPSQNPNPAPTPASPQP